jgi:hypothetical protein
MDAVDTTALGRVGLMRARWREAWPESWADGERRAEMIDRHAWIHAASAHVDGVGAPVHELAGRLASASLLAEQVAREELGEALVDEAAGPFAPVTAEAGATPLRVERSRPGWHLLGTARSVPWAAVERSLVVLGIDEGDNAVVALVDVAAHGVGVESDGAGAATVRFDDVPVEDRRVTHARDAGAALRDRLTVLALLAAVERMEGRTTPAGHDDVAVCRAAVGAAVRASSSARPLVRQHDVSAAALVVLLTCARLDVRADGVGEPRWHRERLAPLL